MLRRLPQARDILPVYAVIVTIVFSWSILAFIWKLPSWISFLNLGEILSISSYMLSVDLLESLFWLAVMLIIGMLLPSTALRDHFAVRGTIISFLSLSSLALFINRYAEWEEALLNYSVLWMVGTILISILMAYLSSRISSLASGALWVGERLTVFVFLYIPLAVISLLAVVIRNIF